MTSREPSLRRAIAKSLRLAPAGIGWFFLANAGAATLVGENPYPPLWAWPLVAWSIIVLAIQMHRHEGGRPA